MKTVNQSIIANVIHQNLSYYNEIAADYNLIMSRENSNAIIREMVGTKFRHIVKPGVVLDFGGGTGLDINWLIENEYHVLFCEPSFRMRQKAMDNMKNYSSTLTVSFLNDFNSDFTNWGYTPPFPQMVDAILSNFATINCIPGIQLLFKNLASVLKKGGHLIALVLDIHSRKMLNPGYIARMKSFFFQITLQVNIEYKEKRQTVYIYSLQELKKASCEYFNFSSFERLEEYGFTLIHLIKK